MNLTRVLMFALAIGGACVTAAPAQEVRFSRRLDKNRVEVIVGGEKMLAFPDSALTRMLIEHAQAERDRKLVAVQDSMLAQYDRTVNSCKVLRESATTYTKTLQEQLADYEQLTDNYRKLMRGAVPKLSVVGGVGATGSDTEPAIMAGLEIGKFRVLWFGQEGNQGVLAGGSFRIF